jgi:hypothetical protein
MSRWVVAQLFAACFLAMFGVWSAEPELALALSLGIGAAAVNPRKWWTVPLVAGGTAAAGAMFQAFELPAVLAAGAAAGALATWTLPHRADALTLVHGALGTLIGSTVGLYAANSIHFAPGAPYLLQVLTWAGMSGLLGSLGLATTAWRFDHLQHVPTAAEVAAALEERYRPPVLRAIDLFRGARGPLEPATRQGLGEVVIWVYRLQLGLQTLDGELAGIDPSHVAQRIAESESAADDDAFTRERRQATAGHLRRLLEHRSAIEVERGRTDALSEYALAFLEEARAGLAIAQPLPGEAVPDRLPEVLGKLRTQAHAGQARRATAREIGQLEQK